MPQEKLDSLKERLNSTSFFSGIQADLQTKFQSVFNEEQIDNMLKIDKNLGYEKENHEMIYEALNLITAEEKLAIYRHFVAKTY